MIDETWQVAAGTLSASIGSAWIMIKVHTKRIDKIEDRTELLEKEKATREELTNAVESVRKEMSRGIDRVEKSTAKIYDRIDDLHLVLLSRSDEKNSTK